MKTSLLISLLALSAVLFSSTACSRSGNFANSGKSGSSSAVNVPFPELANLGQIPPPLMSRARIKKISGRANGRVADLNRQSTTSPSTNPSSPALKEGEIKNIAAQGPEGAPISGSGNASPGTNAGKRTREQRNKEIEQANKLRIATVNAYNKERQKQQTMARARQEEIARRRAEFEARKAAAENQKAKMIAALTNIPEPRTNSDLFSLKDLEQVAIIYYGPGESKIKEADQKILVEAAHLLKNKGGKLLIVGHSSPPADGIVTKENRMSNIRMSKARTESVAIGLRRIGVPLQLMKLEAMADTKPVYSIKSPNGQSGNRRVEIYRIDSNAQEKNKSEEKT